MKDKMSVKEYNPLIIAAGIGAMLGSGIIVGLAVTVTVWQAGLGLTDNQVGILSGALTFAIAAGSLLAGNIVKRFGLFKPFDYLNILYALGALTCVLSGSFLMLFFGLVMVGFASGADLPISLTVLSHDAKDEKTSARLIAIVQVFWSVGAVFGTVLGFLVSRMEGMTGARIVLGMLGVIAVIGVLVRIFSEKVKALHRAGETYRNAEGNDVKKEVSFQSLFSGEEGKKYLGLFLCITIYYCCWNLLSNTFGQFQTYILVKANASQFLATGIGVVLTFVGLLGGVVFTRVAGSSSRNKWFYVGITMQVFAMTGIALGGKSVLIMVVMLACYNMANPFAGETTYKIWTQESFPVEARASVQGFINGFSRFCCGVFAVFTPMLVTAERMQGTMFAFAGIIIISAIAGTWMIQLQKRYGLGQMG